MDAEAAAIRDIAITDAFEDGVQLLMATPGRVITTGIGKAGFIARKFAATLASTGTPAFFIHPAEAGHGDLGMVTEHDFLAPRPRVSTVLRYHSFINAPINIGHHHEAARGQSPWTSVKT